MVNNLLREVDGLIPYMPRGAMYFMVSCTIYYILIVIC